jgi:hypothetical protein
MGPHIDDIQTLRHISEQFRELASRERNDARRRRYLALASQSRTLSDKLEEELQMHSRGNGLEQPPALHALASSRGLLEARTTKKLGAAK